MPIPAELDGFNVSDAVSRMLDQPALWWQSVEIFVDHYADWVDDWRVSQGDGVQEHKRVHALHGAAANIGAEDLAAAARLMEQALAGGTAGQVEACRVQLQACYHKTWQAAADARLRCGVSEGRC